MGVMERSRTGVLKGHFGVGSFTPKLCVAFFKPPW